MIGQEIGHYRILDKLGEGGMGEVYLAEDTELDRKVALKVLPAEMAEDPERLERFRREAKAVAALNHPNIVTLHSIEQAEGRRFLTMELVEGEQLDRSIPAGGLELGDIFELAIPLADALAAAHEKGIVHRDLKPANILVTKEGRVKVLDFGLAKLTEREAPPEMTQVATEALTQAGVVMGTVPYMSPEQIEGKPVDHRSDIFSLGILLYEMTTGDRPFQGDTSPALMSSILKDAPGSVIETRTDLPRHLGRILIRCLEKDPEDRYQSAKDLLADLRSLKRETESEPVTAMSAPHPARRPRPWGKLAAVLAVLLAFVGAAVFFYPRQTDQIDSLAVLPFENGSGDPDSEYFSDGVTESIISSLSQLPDMKVISRTSAFHYKGQVVDPKQVGQELGVQALVLGRIVQRGDDLMVSAELVRASDNGQIWGQQYQRQASDIFSIQQEIAREISTALRLELTSDQEERLTRQHTESSAAYEAYLKGRHAWNQRTVAGFRQAIDYFQEAIDTDSTYALAYAGLADCYSLLGYYSTPPREAYPQARAAAERALELDESLAEAHTSLAWVKMMFDWDFDAASQEFERAIELNPSYATTYHWFAVISVPKGQLDEGATQLKIAVELDPMSRIINTEYGFWLALAGRSQEAETQFEKARALDPNFPILYLRQATIFMLQDRVDESVNAYEKGVELLGGAYGLGKLGHAYAKLGRLDDSRAVLDRLDELSTQQYVPPLETAFVYAGLGERDRSFEYLEQAYEDRVGDLVLVGFMLKADLGDDPRFDDLLRRIGIPRGRLTDLN